MYCSQHVKQKGEKQPMISSAFLWAIEQTPWQNIIDVD